MPDCLIGLGSNLGDRLATLTSAVARLAEHGSIEITAVSSWRETAAVGGPPAQPPFLNGALRLQTSLRPHELLTLLQQVENELGRERTQRWGPRSIDLDLLLYGEMVLKSSSLVIPHPRMAWRRFVLEPAAEIAGEMLHAPTGWTIAQLFEHLKSARPYIAVTGPIGAGKTRLARRLAAAIFARLIVERPAWAKLGVFYADPPSHARQMELEFLAERVRLLNAEKGDSPRPTFGRCPPERPEGGHRRAALVVAQMGTAPFFRWVVSDFWFDQSAAFAQAWLPKGDLPAFLREFERLRPAVVPPKLIVLLDAPTEQLLVRVRRRGRICERHLNYEQLDRIRNAMREMADRPGLGPVLRASGEDPDAALAEALAAVRSME